MLRQEMLRVFKRCDGRPSSGTKGPAIEVAYRDEPKQRVHTRRAEDKLTIFFSSLFFFFQNRRSSRVGLNEKRLPLNRGVPGVLSPSLMAGDQRVVARKHVVACDVATAFARSHQ